MSTRTIIIDAMRRVADEQQRTLGPLHDDALLLTVGLDSLCFAILVARLEEALNVDPFGASDEIELPVTVGDFVRFYEKAMV